MRWVGAVRSSWSLLSKTAPVSQLGGAVWSAARRFSPKVSPKVTAFEFAVSRPSLVARLIPVVSSQTDGNTRDHDWPSSRQLQQSSSTVLGTLSLTKSLAMSRMAPIAMWTPRTATEGRFCAATLLLVEVCSSGAWSLLRNTPFHRRACTSITMWHALPCRGNRILHTLLRQ